MAEIQNAGRATGSTKYIWDEDYLRNAIHYVLHRQGLPMEGYAEDPLDACRGTF